MSDPTAHVTPASRRWLGLFGVLAVLFCLCAVGVYVLRDRVVPAAPPTASGAWYQVYFTAPAFPDDPSKHQGAIDSKLVALMDQAQKTLDVADYDFDLANVADAMVRAKGRGVTVRMVTDSDTFGNKDARIQDAFNKLKRAGIPIVDDQRSAIMHNKFSVVDRFWVSTGSWNYTDGDTYHLNNNMIVIQSPELAANYSAEFEKMFVKRKFGPTKDKGVPNPVLTIGDSHVENYFASEEPVAPHVIDTLRKATSSVYFLAFSFTHDGIGQAIIDRKKAGAKVIGVFETTGSNTQFSEYGKMKAAGLEVYQDGNPC
jgi:phosphatidylserine/phosphatidylglycerophosphate/cardiolipin synthase-like enzyme